MALDGVWETPASHRLPRTAPAPLPSPASCDRSAPRRRGPAPGCHYLARPPDAASVAPGHGAEQKKNSALARADRFRV